MKAHGLAQGSEITGQEPPGGGGVPFNLVQAGETSPAAQKGPG